MFYFGHHFDYDNLSQSYGYILNRKSVTSGYFRYVDFASVGCFRLTNEMSTLHTPPFRNMTLAFIDKHLQNRTVCLFTWKLRF